MRDRFRAVAPIIPVVMRSDDVIVGASAGRVRERVFLRYDCNEGERWGLGGIAKRV